MKILELICSAEKKAAELMLEAEKITAMSKTDSRNVVTEYDRKIQEYLVETFRAALPDAHFFCEESDEPDSLDAEHVFIIDPIDGTMNFVHGFRHSCISVAYMSAGKPLCAAVYNPYAGEMFTAEAGCGAFLNGKPLHVDDCGMKNGIACIGTSPYRPDIIDENFVMIRKVYDNSLDIRREGSAELDLCSVAAGRAAFYCELSVSFWDYAAGALIVSEAGGMCLRADGTPLPFDESKTSIIAGGPVAVEDFRLLNLF